MSWKICAIVLFKFPTRRYTWIWYQMQTNKFVCTQIGICQLHERRSVMFNHMCIWPHFIVKVTGWYQLFTTITWEKLLQAVTKLMESSLHRKSFLTPQLWAYVRAYACKDDLQGLCSVEIMTGTSEQYFSDFVLSMIISRS